MTRRQALLAPLAFASGAPVATAASAVCCQRLTAPEGLVRVFKPRNYDPATAGLVIYVHGLYTTVDQAWDEHRLPQQFARSRRNALFVVPAARAEATASPPWSDLQTLLDRVASEVADAPAAGPLVVAGHSGAYKQIVLWLPHPRLQTLLLLDALYGGQPALRAWLDAAPDHRMSLVSHDTIAAARAFVDDIPSGIHRKRCPQRFAFPDRRRACRQGPVHGHSHRSLRHRHRGQGAAVAAALVRVARTFVTAAWADEDERSLPRRVGRAVTARR